MVPGARFELARVNTHYPLKIACLPVPPTRHCEKDYSREGHARQRYPMTKFWEVVSEASPKSLREWFYDSSKILCWIRSLPLTGCGFRTVAFINR